MTKLDSILAWVFENEINDVNMKPIAAAVVENISDDQVFAVKEINLPYFSTEFHFHKECQIVYVVESEGKRIIGDNIEHFADDELIFLGSDIPHVWHNDQQYFDTQTKMQARSIAVFFNAEALLKHLHCCGNTKKLEMMLQHASRGMKFFGDTKAQLKNLLLQALQLKGLLAFINFLNMLELMSTSKEFELLASEGYVNLYQNRDNDRMDRVFKYVMDYFKDVITLEAAAGIAGMNVQAFCRYFKTRTQKPFMQFVNEIRVGHACKLLSAGEMSVTSVAFDCGYNSISNFNRFFKEIKGVTPREYRKLVF